ncbi:large ribosomal subunit protein bL32m [Atheta coriaria]|uniref:large ribosomal subunit protein bL32m n=1 Tax=Dalotia coriaria TaxID=877792 RepID=UPI0031F3CE99
MAGLLRNVHLALRRLELHIANALARQFPPEAYALNVLHLDDTPTKQGKSFSLKDILNDAFLYAVPKHRRSLEKRQKRRFGLPEYNWKMLSPKTNIRTCNVCGDDHEAGKLCPTCYSKVIEETKRMQDKIQAELKLEPVEKEVVVLYEGEKDDKPAEFWKGKRIVEMETTRPAWFSKNLTEKTTQQPATTKDVKPNQLG